MIRKPEFIVCGVQKSGTTALSYYLSKHRNISMMPKGETHFFDNNENYQKGPDAFDFLTKADEKKIIGQNSSTYIYSYVPERIKKYFPHVKLIFILRNPVSRAYSHYWHAVSKFREDLSFEDALNVEEERISKSLFHLMNYSYKSSGHYMEMISNFLEFFPKEQMYFIIFEQFKKDPKTEINNYLKFIGQKPFEEIPALRKHKSTTRIPKNKTAGKLLYNQFTRKYGFCYPLVYTYKKIFSKDYPPMKQTTKDELINYYAVNNQSLAQFLKKDLSFWNL